MKLFLDDRRPCPAGWAKVANIEAFKYVVRTQTLEEVSLDHDLEIPHYGYDYTNGRTGYDALKFLLDYYTLNELKLPVIKFHTANQEGYDRMKTLLELYKSNTLNSIK